MVFSLSEKKQTKNNRVRAILLSFESVSSNVFRIFVKDIFKIQAAVDNLSRTNVTTLKRRKQSTPECKSLSSRDHEVLLLWSGVIVLPVLVFVRNNKQRMHDKDQGCG